MANFCMSEELADLLRVIEQDERALEEAHLTNAIDLSVNMRFL